MSCTRTKRQRQRKRDKQAYAHRTHTIESTTWPHVYATRPIDILPLLRKSSQIVWNTQQWALKSHKNECIYLPRQINIVRFFRLVQFLCEIHFVRLIIFMFLPRQAKIHNSSMISEKKVLWIRKWPCSRNCFLSPFFLLETARAKPVGVRVFAQSSAH